MFLSFFFFRGLAGRLDLFLFLRPAGAERTPTAFFERKKFVWMAGLVAMARRVAVCLRGTAELLGCWTSSGAPCPWGAEPRAVGAAGRSCRDMAKGMIGSGSPELDT